MGHRNETSAAVSTPISNPAVVRPAHRLRIVHVVALGFPRQLEARVNDGGVEALKIQSFDTLLGVGGAKRKPLAIFYPRIEFTFFTRHLTHLRNRAEVAAPADARRHAVDFEILKSILVLLHADRISPVLSLAVLLPAFDRFQDVTVGVYGARIFELVNFPFDACHFEPTSLRFELS